MTVAALLNSEVAVAFITGLLGVIGIGVGEVLRRQCKAIKGVREDSAVAREQVQNKHGTNLRDDLDLMAHDIKTLVRGQEQHQQMLEAHQTALSSLRVDMSWERRERMALASRIQWHLEKGDILA